MKQEDLDRIAEAYSSSARIYAEKCYHELDYKPLDRLLLDRFIEIIQPGGIVCDIGCGPGEVAVYLHTRGVCVIGIDISDGMITEARRLNPAVSFTMGDMGKLSLSGGYLSGICSFYVIVNYRYDDLRPVFMEYHRVLIPGGVLLLSFHVGTEVVHTDDFFESGKSLDFYYYDEAIIMDSLKETGFVITEALVRYPYPEEYPSRRAYITAVKTGTALPCIR